MSPSSNSRDSGIAKAATTTAAKPARPTAPAAASGHAPRWATLGTALTALAGLGASLYLTIAHYTAAVTLACPQTTTVNCAKVTSSAQSQFLGIPVAVLGLAFFAAMLPLCSPPACRAESSAPRWIRGLMALAGVGFVAWLVYAELFIIDAICLWCTTVHVLTLALFALTALGTAAAPRRTPPGIRMNG